MAAQGNDIGSVALVMVTFAVGTAPPSLLIKGLSHMNLRGWQGRMIGAGKTGERLLGATVLAVAMLILTGTDHLVEASLVTASPS